MITVGLSQLQKKQLLNNLLNVNSSPMSKSITLEEVADTTPKHRWALIYYNE